MRTNPIEKLVVQSRNMVINVIPPIEDKSPGKNKQKRSNSGSENDTFVENIYSASIFTQYYDHKLFKPYFWMMMILGWKPFPCKRIISTDPGFLWKISNLLYPLLVFAALTSGFVLKVITCYHDFPQIHPTLGQNSSRCLGLLYPRRDVNSSTLNYNHTTASGFEALYLQKRIYFFGLSLPIKRNILFPLFVQEFYNNVLPETLLFILYIFGYYLFRYKDWELAHTIMEMTFLRVQPSVSGEEELLSDPASTSGHYYTSREKRLIQIRNSNLRRGAKSFFDFKKVHTYTLLWLGLGLALLSLRSAHLVNESHVTRLDTCNSHRTYQATVIAVMAISSFLCYVTLAVIFCTHLLLLQALMFMLRHAKERILNRQMDFDSAKKEFYRIKVWLDALNAEFAFPLAIFMVVTLLRILARAQMISRFWIYVQYSGLPQEQLFWVWRESGIPEPSNGTWNILGTTLVDAEKHKSAQLAALRCLPVVEIVLSMLVYKMCLTYPLIKASQLGTVGQLHNYVGLEVAAKPYGFDANSQASMDSFVAFTKAMVLRSKILFLSPNFAWFGVFICFAIFATPWHYGLH